MTARRNSGSGHETAAKSGLGRKTACDPHALGGDQCGEQRGSDLMHSTTQHGSIFFAALSVVPCVRLWIRYLCTVDAGSTDVSMQLARKLGHTKPEGSFKALAWATHSLFAFAVRPSGKGMDQDSVAKTLIGILCEEGRACTQQVFAALEICGHGEQRPRGTETHGTA